MVVVVPVIGLHASYCPGSYQKNPFVKFRAPYDLGYKPRVVLSCAIIYENEKEWDNAGLRLDDLDNRENR